MRPILIGHSCGGAVMLQYLLDYPDQVAGAISLAGVAFSPADPPEAYVDTISALYLRPSQLIATAAELAAMHDSVLGMSPRYPEITTPVTIVFGARDRMLDAGRDGRRLHGALPAATFIEVEDAGHYEASRGVPRSGSSPGTLRERFDS